SLVDRVGQLCERVRVLAAEDDELESLHELRVVFARPRERRDLDRVVQDERRLPQTRLDVLLKELVELLPYRLAPGVLEHQVGHARAPEGRGEVDRLALVGA